MLANNSSSYDDEYSSLFVVPNAQSPKLDLIDALDVDSRHFCEFAIWAFRILMVYFEIYQISSDHLFSLDIPRDLLRCLEIP